MDSIDAVQGAVADGTSAPGYVCARLAAAAPSGGDVVRLEMDGKRVLAGAIERTGWTVVLMLPPAS